nr:immunoglobulin light chain junction region [Macaca mulatta]MOX85151.1 immunoglobulin light chain junction region [Macaca mulatta]MOX85321.1 immunoglobulin light chain junction region [Macaca mulatta]MOX85338.1 immunoglobulin light chain junction region [Macaca mulatta]MOX85532.1 immunoglobulin light chain junction region [Macaca mulatta]
CMQGLEFPYSV